MLDMEKDSAYTLMVLFTLAAGIMARYLVKVLICGQIIPNTMANGKKAR